MKKNVHTDFVPTPKGFTLVETLIAITILTLSIVGPFQVVQSVLLSSYNARDQLIAAGLAQDGIEFVRMVRDSNYLNNVRYGAGSVSWLNGLDGRNGPSCYQSQNGGYQCLVDSAGFISTPYPNGTIYTQNTSAYTCPAQGTCTPGYLPLYVDSNGVYNQAGRGTKTKFSRTLVFTQISATETLVTITVSWENHGAKSVVLNEYLQNWL